MIIWYEANRPTLYELAKAENADVQNEGIPKLAQWLFTEYFKEFVGETQQAIVLEFISAFTRKYINREIFHKNKEVFRSALYYELNKYYDYLSTVQDEYKGLVDADVFLNETENIDRDLKDDTTMHGTSNRITDMKGTNTGTQITKDVSSGNTANNTSGNTSETGTVGIAERMIGSDYPQSNISQDVEPVFNYDYASGSRDLHKTDTRNLGSTQKTDVTGSYSDEADIQRTDDLKNSLDGTEDITNNNTNIKMVDDTIVRTKNIDSISNFDKLLRILEYLDKNPYSPIYTVVEKLEKLFISTYIDEDRDGYVDPSCNITKYIVGVPL